MLSFLILTVVFAHFGFDGEASTVSDGRRHGVRCVYTIRKMPQTLLLFYCAEFAETTLQSRHSGIQNIPATGGVFAAGQPCQLDRLGYRKSPAPSGAFCDDQSIYEHKYLKWLFRLYGCVPPIANSASRQSLDTISELP